MAEQPPPEGITVISKEVPIGSSTTQEETEVNTSNLEKTTTMQTTEAESNENGDIIAIVKQPAAENVPPAQVVEEDNMNDIPGIRVSMATIVELPPLEE